MHFGFYNCYYEKIGKEVKKIDDELPFDIPSNWIWIRVSSFCDVYTGNSINEEEKLKKYVGLTEGLDYIGTKDVQFDHSIIYENGVKIPSSSNAFRKCPSGKILLCIEGGSAGRKIGITNHNVCFGNKLACFNSWIINDIYLFIYLQSFSFQQIFKENASGIISGVSISNIKGLLVPLPPINEQKRIVDKFNGLLPFINYYDSIEERLTALEQSFENKLKASILQYAMEGKLVKQDPNDEPASMLLERIAEEKEKLIKEGKIKKDKQDKLINLTDDKNYYEKINSIPSNWKLSYLCNLCSLISRGKSPKYSLVFKEYPVLAQKCNQWDGIHMDKCLFIEPFSIVRYSNEYFLKDKDIVLNSTGGGTVGRTGFIDEKVFYKFKRIVWDSHITLIRCSKAIYSKFVFYFFRSPLFQSNIEEKCEGSTNQMELYAKTLKSLLLPIPPYKEQERISKKIDRLFETI